MDSGIILWTAAGMRERGWERQHQLRDSGGKEEDLAGPGTVHPCRKAKQSV